VVQANTASTRMLATAKIARGGRAVIEGVHFGLMGEPADDERQHEDSGKQPAQHLAGRRLLNDGRRQCRIPERRQEAQAQAENC
jgi:hypothetical protein